MPLAETDLHAAIVSAMNERFSMGNVQSLLKDSILSALSSKGEGMSLAAIDSRLTELREKQYHFLQLAAAVGAGSTQYDEMLKQISIEFSSLVAKHTELEKAQETVSCANERATQITAELDRTEPGITEFDEVAVRQLIDAIKVMGKDKLLIRFKDGMELEQPITPLR